MIDIEKVKEALHMIDRSVGNHGWFDSNDVYVIEQAIDKLERLQAKEIPMKVNIQWTQKGKHHRFEAFCSNCNYELCMTEQDRYCGNCGQEIDWRDKV